MINDKYLLTIFGDFGIVQKHLYIINLFRNDKIRLTGYLCALNLVNEKHFDHFSL